MKEYNGSELFGMHYNIFPRLLLLHTSKVYCGGQTSDHVIHMRRLGHSKGQKKEQQSLSKAHYFYFKINIISKSTTAFVLTRI